jgi:hypothetical protein
MDFPRITVLVAAHDAESTIDETVRSVLAQTITDFELLIVDDASTDSTRRQVQAHHDPRIRLISLNENVGPAAARNIGVRQAAAELIAVLDADDVSYDRRLECQLAYINSHPRCDLLGSAFDVIDEAGRPTGHFEPPCDTTMIRWRLLTTNAICNSTSLFRRQAALAAGGFDETLRVGEDYSLWAAMAPHTEVAQLSSRLVAYREHPGGLSTVHSAEVADARRRVAGRALSAAVGHEVSPAAVECLTEPSAAGRSAAGYREAVTTLTEALRRAVRWSHEGRELEGALVEDWRRQMTALCAGVPRALPLVLWTALGLAASSVGPRSLDGDSAVWAWRALKTAAASALSADW